MKIGAPPVLESGSWEGVTDTYYNAVGGEAFWLYISIALCVIALIGGAIHEAKAYRRAENIHRDV